MGITFDCKENLISYLANQSPTPPTHIALGDDNTAFSESDTVLGNELSRKAIETTTIKGDNRKVEYNTVFNTTELVGETIKEIGLFNAATSGTLFQRVVLGDIDKDDTFSIKVIITLKVI